LIAKKFTVLNQFRTISPCSYMYIQYMGSAYWVFDYWEATPNATHARPSHLKMIPPVFRFLPVALTFFSTIFRLPSETLEKAQKNRKKHKKVLFPIDFSGCRILFD